MAAWGGDADGERDNQRLDGVVRKITIFLGANQQPMMNEFKNSCFWTSTPLPEASRERKRFQKLS